MLVFFLKPTAALKKALLKHADARPVRSSRYSRLDMFSSRISRA